MECTLITHRSPAYDEMVALRMDLLRRPLGLAYTPDQLESEKEDILVGAYENGQLAGCCVLTHRTETTIQLRQMAVRQDLQSKGVGRSIIAFSEATARQRGYKVLMMHARNVALAFYKKCGYHVVGSEFMEVGIPHHHMEKTLAD